MTRPLDGVRLRLDRADECLAFLDVERTALLHAKGDRVEGHFDTGAPDYVYRVPGDPPPLHWGITISEYAHALRSTLDNVLWQLVKTRGGHLGRHLQFPIYEDKAKAFVKTKGGVPKIEAQTSGVSCPDFTFIEGLQPYKAGPILAKWQPLAMLGHLNDVDKHRYIHAAFAAAVSVPMGGAHAGRPFFESSRAEAHQRIALFTEPPDPALFEQIGPRQWRLRFLMHSIGPAQVPYEGINGPYTRTSYDGSDDDPAEVMRVHDIRPRSNAKVDMEPRLSFDISFSDRDRPLSILDLREIRTAVQEVVDRFGPEIE